MAYTPWNCCVFCGEHADSDHLVKYGTRHYAHHACYLDAGKPLADLHKWQIERFPYFLLKDRGLLEEVERLMHEADAGGGMTRPPVEPTGPELTPHPPQTAAALKEARRLCDQVKTDLASAHTEICKLKGLEPDDHTWAPWTPQANTVRWIDEKLIPLFDAALADAGEMA